MRKLIKMIFPVLFCLGGLAMLLYPWISNYLYENRADGEVSAYEKQVEKTDDSEKQEILKKAREYNNILTESKVQLTDPFDEEEAKDNGLDYNNILNVNGDGMMGFIDIPKINVYLPVYHGTSKVVLESRDRAPGGIVFTCWRRKYTCCLIQDIPVLARKNFLQI